MYRQYMHCPKHSYIGYHGKIIEYIFDLCMYEWDKLHISDLKNFTSDYSSNPLEQIMLILYQNEKFKHLAPGQVYSFQYILQMLYFMDLIYYF